MAFAISSALIIRNERMKIKAEEEVVRWQEKMAERKKAEEALQLERNKLKGILDSMNDGVYIVNQQYEILYTNPVIEKEFGPVKGRKCHEYFHDLPDGLFLVQESKRSLPGKRSDGNGIPSKPAGPTISLIRRSWVRMEPCANCRFIRDISDRKRAERALRQSEKRYRMLVETMNDGLGVQDEHGVWIYVNDRFCEMLGYPRDEMIGRPRDRFPRRDRSDGL